MGVKTFHTLPGGRRALVDSDVLDLDRKVKYGDPTCGWRGDEIMYVVINTLADVVEVWGVDAHGEPYIVTQTKPDTPDWRFRLLSQLIAGDWQRGSDVIVDEIDARNAQLRRHQETDAEAANLEFSEKLAWAIAKDLGEPSIYGTFYADKEPT